MMGTKRETRRRIELITVACCLMLVVEVCHAWSFPVNTRLATGNMAATTATTTSRRGVCFARKRRRDEYENYESYDNERDENSKYEDEYDEYDRDNKFDSSTSFDFFQPSPTRSAIPSSLSRALLAGVFILGVGTGVTVETAITTDPKDLASRDAIDRNAPNAQLCTSYGASAMAFDQRVFVSFDPFDVYVAQADVKPACVLRPSNVVPVLRDASRKRGPLLTEQEVRSCKQNMNTWAFVGDLDQVPQLSCVYKSDDAQNEFLSEDPTLGIGEDVWDDDRAEGRLSTGKLVKDGTARKKEQLNKMITQGKGFWSD